MPNSKSAYFITYNNIWKMVSISNINAVSFPITLIQSGQTHNQTNSFNNTTCTGPAALIVFEYLFN